MTSPHRSEYSKNDEAPNPSTCRFRLRLVVLSFDPVIQIVMDIINKHSLSPAPVVGVIEGEMELTTEISGLRVCDAEQLARRLMRTTQVLRLSGAYIDASDQEVFGINLYEKRNRISPGKKHAEAP